VKLRRMHLAPAALAAMMGVLLFCGGCENSGNEFQRLVCEVSQINEGVPLVSGYLNAGPDRIVGTVDDFFPIDYAEIIFHARPYSSLVTMVEDGPHSYFHVTSYDLIWHPLSPGSEPLVNYGITGAGVDVLVPVYEDAAVSILIADRYMKEQSFFSDLFFGTQIPFTARCELRFHGHETGSQDEVVVPASFMVSCVGVVID
jgi:hypothetical protein